MLRNNHTLYSLKLSHIKLNTKIQRTNNIDILDLYTLKSTHVYVW